MRTLTPESQKNVSQKCRGSKMEILRGSHLCGIEKTWWRGKKGEKNSGKQISK